jgi:hypothetical protein
VSAFQAGVLLVAFIIGTNGPLILPLFRRLTADNRCAAIQMSLSIPCRFPIPRFTAGIFLNGGFSQTWGNRQTHGHLSKVAPASPLFVSHCAKKPNPIK